MSVSEARYWWDSHLQSAQSIARGPVGAAYNAMVEECAKEQLAEMVLDLMHEKREMAKAHDARVTELLAANNVMVEKRRELARENYKLQIGIGEMTERLAASHPKKQISSMTWSDGIALEDLAEVR